MIIKSSLIKKIIKTEDYNIQDILRMKGKVFSYVNPVTYLDAVKHTDLIASMDGLFVDGSLMAAAVHICYGRRITRRSPDLVGYFLELFDLDLTLNNIMFLSQKGFFFFVIMQILHCYTNFF